MTYADRFSGAIRRVVDAMPFIESRNTKIKRQKYAARIVSKVLRIVGDSEGERLKIVPEFRLAEIDLADFALRTLCDRGIVRKEVRYYIERTPNP